MLAAHRNTAWGRKLLSFQWALPSDRLDLVTGKCDGMSLPWLGYKTDFALWCGLSGLCCDGDGYLGSLWPTVSQGMRSSVKPPARQWILVRIRVHLEKQVLLTGTLSCCGSSWHSEQSLVWEKTHLSVPRFPNHRNWDNKCVVLSH